MKSLLRKILFYFKNYLFEPKNITLLKDDSAIFVKHCMKIKIFAQNKRKNISCSIKQKLHYKLDIYCNYMMNYNILGVNRIRDFDIKYLNDYNTIYSM